MLFIQDDEAQVRHGGEYGAARPQDNVEVAPVYAPPGVVLLPGGEPTVEEADTAWKAPQEALGELRRQGDFGDQVEPSPALGNAAGQGLQIDLRLAAAGDAQEQERTPIGAFDRGCDGFDSRRLLGCEVQGRLTTSRMPS